MVAAATLVAEPATAVVVVVAPLGAPVVVVVAPVGALVVVVVALVGALVVVVVALVVVVSEVLLVVVLLVVVPLVVVVVVVDGQSPSTHSSLPRTRVWVGLANTSVTTSLLTGRKSALTGRPLTMWQTSTRSGPLWLRVVMVTVPVVVVPVVNCGLLTFPPTLRVLLEVWLALAFPLAVALWPVGGSAAEAWPRALVARKPINMSAVRPSDSTRSNAPEAVGRLATFVSCVVVPGCI